MAVLTPSHLPAGPSTPLVLSPVDTVSVLVSASATTWVSALLLPALVWRATCQNQQFQSRTRKQIY